MLLLIATAIALGMLHTVAPDHLAAVSVFVSRRPHWRDAAAYGARWGFGHSLSIVLVGGVAALFAWRIPHALEPRLEQAVGVMLVVLGVLAWRRCAGATHASHDNAASAHTHAHPHAHDDGGALLGIGMMHGLAGSGALVAALPAAAVRTPMEVMTYLASFGAGTIVAMAALAMLLGGALRVATTRAARLQVVLVRGAAALSVVVGGWWVAAA